MGLTERIRNEGEKLEPPDQDFVAEIEQNIQEVNADIEFIDNIEGNLEFLESIDPSTLLQVPQTPENNPRSRMEILKRLGEE